MKTNFKQILVVLLVIVLSISICLLSVACVDNTPDDTDPNQNTTTENKTLLITNGDFSTTSGTNMPATPGTWSASSSSGSGANVKGVIPTDTAAYDRAKSAWDSLANPGSPNDEEANKVLMIYNKEAGANSYYTTFQTAIGAYYKLTASVRVVGGNVGTVEGSGAYIRYSGAVYQEFGPIAAGDNWTTVTFYVAASQTNTQSITITLANGISGNHNTGYAFFDDVLATKITASEYTTAVAQTGTAFYSMLTPDADFINFDHYSSNTVKSPNTWTGAVGKDDDGLNQCSSSYVNAGVISVEDDQWTKWCDTIKTDRTNPGTPFSKGKEGDLSDDNFILAISNDRALAVNGVSNYEDAYTAYGYTKSGNRTINVEPGTIFRLSVWVCTDLNDAASIKEQFADKEGVDSDIDHSTYGANIKLSGSKDYMFSNIDTKGEWVQYSFILFGHEFRSKTLSLELWLGQGGTESTTRASGTVYFDNIRLERLELIGEDRDGKINQYKDPAQYNQDVNQVVDVTSLDGSSMTAEDLITNPNFEEGFVEGSLNGWKLEAINGIRDTEKDVLYGLLNTQQLAQDVADAVKRDAYESDDAYNEAVTKWWMDNYKISANPSAPYGLDPVLMINNVNPTAYRLQSDQEWEIKKNLHYRLAIWVKTVDIPTGSGITVNLNYAEDDSAFMSFSTVNTASYVNELTNDYVELVFYIQGSNLVSLSGADNNKVYLQIDMGAGNNYDTSKFVKGQMFIANINMEQVTYSEYSNAATGTYVKSSSMSASKGTVSNGSFDSASYDEDKIDLVTGNQTELLTPASWTEKDVENVTSGILNINSTALADKLFGNGFVVYNEWDDSVDTIKPIDFGAPNVYVAKTDEGKTTDAKQLLKSSSITLSSGSYYMFKAYVRASIGMEGQIEISSSNTNSTPIIADFVGTDKWQEIIFVIETGNFGSTTVYFSLYMGQYSVQNELEEADRKQYSGTIFADSFTYYSITKAEYEAGKGDSNFRSYITDTFTTTSTSATVTAPSQWTGSGASSQSYVNNDTMVCGIYNKRYTTSEVGFKDTVTTTDDDGNTKTELVDNPDKTLNKDALFDETGLPEGTLDNNLLIINNKTESYYQYKKSSSFNMSKDTCYRLSIDARTYFIAEGQNAILRITSGTGTSATTYDLPINSDYRRAIDGDSYKVDADDKPVYEQRDNQWDTYNFYIRTTANTTLSTVYVSLILGEKESQVQGYALFDNVTLTKIDVDEFTEAYAQCYVLDDEGEATVDEDGKKVQADTYLTYNYNNRVIRLSDAVEQSGDTDDQEPETPPTDSSLIWLYITSIVIAVILIVVIVVVLVRRIARRKGNKRKANKPVSYTRKTAIENKKDDKSNAKGDEFDE